jgi:hypothetical protein
MQVEEYDTEKFSPESLLYRPQTTQSREFQSSPRGLLISAGIEAMDTLYDHGIALGDIVWITQLGVLRLPYLRVGSEDLYFMVLQVGDIAAGEDTYNRLQSGELALKHDPASNTHYYQWRGQPARVPGKAFVPQEF